MLAENESPSYLLSRGEKSKAEASAKALWGENYASELYGSGGSSTDIESGGAAIRSPSSCRAESNYIRAQSGTRKLSRFSLLLCTGSSTKDDVSWGEMFKGTNGRLVAIAASLFIVQQLSGINAIVYFSSSVFRDAGVPSEALASAAVGLINVIGTLVAVSLMDRSGRKYVFHLCACSPCQASSAGPMPRLCLSDLSCAVCSAGSS